MTFQTNWNSYVAYKIQSALNSQASGGSGRVLRIADGSQGGKMTRAAYGSKEQRRDGMRTKGRGGSRDTAGTYPTELMRGECEDIRLALMRGAYSTADLAITEATASLTSITTTTSTIVAGAGSWLTAGVRANEVWRLTGHATAANNGINLLVTGVTASTITVAGTPLTLNATPDTAFTLTRTGRKLINPAAGSLVRSYFTIEEPELDIDSSEVFTDTIWTSLKYGLTKDNLISEEWGWMGTGAFETKTGASCPFLTSPTEGTAAPMAVVDAALYYNGTAVTDLISFDMTIDLHAGKPPTVATVAPDVTTGAMGVSLNIGMLRDGLSKIADFTAETQLSINVLAVELESEPKDFVLLNIPNITIGDIAKSAMSREGGFRTQTLSIPEDMVGIDNAGGAYDSTMVKWQLSTAS